jgi:NADH:ubiquinone oxidoreductase subunit K
MNVGLPHFLILSAGMFCCGLICLVTRKHAVGLIMGIELIVNAANLNFVAFANYRGHEAAGQVFALFGIVVAAIGVSISLAIIFSLYRNFNKSVEVDDATALRG